jgi:predicted transposase/invertase (TIGR01784 family)
MTDTLFKMLFVQNPELLRKLVGHLLSIPYSTITQFEITNPEIPPEYIGEKFCRLDINVIINGQRCNLEIQVQNEGHFTERVLYYWARGYSSALPAGEDYSELPRTIVVNIVGFEAFECSEYHSEFAVIEVNRHTAFGDKLCLHVFELPKLPKLADTNDKQLLWLSLFRAKTEEELQSIISMGVPEMTEAVEAYRSTAVSPAFRELERLRTKARHDEAQALRNALRKGIEQGIEQGVLLGAQANALNAIRLNLSDELIATITGLSLGEIQELRRKDVSGEK